MLDAHQRKSLSARLIVEMDPTGKPYRCLFRQIGPALCPPPPYVDFHFMLRFGDLVKQFLSLVHVPEPDITIS